MTLLPLHRSVLRLPRKARAVAPGLAACLAVTAAAYGLAFGETVLLGRAWLEALVLAIVIGTLLRSLWTPPSAWIPGIAFGAKYLLELAVVLLGAALSTAALQSAGPALLAGIAATVVLAILVSAAVGLLLGLSLRMALLIACGNSICGNSAIAAVAPVIGARGDEVAAAIAFTAVLGVAVVLALPLAGIALGMGEAGYGAFAGLTVYAVPQVIAAASPFGALAVQTGTLVKLTRVMMLGPVCLVLSLLAPHLGAGGSDGSPDGDARPYSLHGADGRGRRDVPLVPWFILGFLAMAGLRGLGLIPSELLPILGTAATGLTVVSMAALGLGVDIRAVTAAGGRVMAAAVLSLAALAALSLLLLILLGLA
ncbi:YeiH family protein [Aureimonas glaciei]|jgi:uncharacterized integral membrane protein (TIGR00698 family)|uniref:UPF0324 membrane protein n=1 Tax=Aureimonas glaciei TaxID=1776957 RepID=A0A916V1J7_9HYPH|nr:putative sulfate exporter family transporter [Aureimonas glaciei]GGD02506.1 UPF0324 membrane protein [Aureimonas glaciei]